MRRLALEDHRSPEVQTLAGEVQDPFGLDAWLRAVWVYVPDPLDAEYVKSPTFQFHEALEHYQQTGQIIFRGDCDDASTLAASILAALDYPVWFTAIRMPENPEFEHVFTSVRMGAHVMDIDPIVPLEEMPILGVAEVMEVEL